MFFRGFYVWTLRLARAVPVSSEAEFAVGLPSEIVRSPADKMRTDGESWRDKTVF